MSIVVGLFVRLAFGLALLGVSHPRAGVVVIIAWWRAVSVARKLGATAPHGVLLPFAALVFLWTHRRDVREMIAAGVVAGAAALWVWALIYAPPGDRARIAAVSVLVAVVGAGVWAVRYLDGAAPTPANFRAARAQSLREWDAERTVAAVTDDAVRVSDVHAVDGGAVVATVTVAAGQSPVDLEDHLRDKLAGTVHRLTGRRAVLVTVAHTATDGVLRVRLDTGHPLADVVLWRDL